MITRYLKQSITPLTVCSSILVNFNLQNKSLGVVLIKNKGKIGSEFKKPKATKTKELWMNRRNPIIATLVLSTTEF